MIKVHLLFIWLLPLNALAQNLVSNPGFELFYDYPTSLRQLNKTKNWYAGNSGTPEYFRTDSEILNGKSNSGKGYVGLILFGGYQDVIEYVGTELKKTLIENQRYCASFYIRAVESYMYIDQIGMLITPNKVSLTVWAPIYKKPQLISAYSEPITPELGWKKIVGEFIAKGGEKYILIGNFIRPEKHVKHIDEFVSKPSLGWNSYYLIDDVYLTTLHNDETCNTQLKKEIKSPLKKEKKITLYFDVDKYKLSVEELGRLNSFIKELRETKVKKIVLKSNTDFDESNAYNLILSKKRANYVLSKLDAKFKNADFVIDNNGESQPVANNKSEKGKKQNRNVQLIITGF